MPLNTQIIRDGEPLKLKWDGFHVTAMILAAAYDSGKGPFRGKQEPQFKFGDDESVPEDWKDKDQSSYPDVPQPISQGDTFRLTNYGIIAQTPLKHGRYILKKRHKFVFTLNSEVLELLPGDELIATRSHKH